MDSIKYFFLNITEAEWLFLSFVALALFICISYQKIYLHKNSKDTKRLDLILQCGSIFFAIMFASMGMLFTEKASKDYKQELQTHYSKTMLDYIQSNMQESGTFGFKLCDATHYQGKECTNYLNFLEASIVGSPHTSHNVEIIHKGHYYLAILLFGFVGLGAILFISLLRFYPTPKESKM